MLIDDEPNFQRSFCTQRFYTLTSLVQYDLKKVNKSFATGACGFLISLVVVNITMRVNLPHYYVIYKPYFRDILCAL